MNYTTQQKLTILLASIKGASTPRLEKLLSLYPDVADIFRHADSPDFPYPMLTPALKEQNKDSLEKCLKRLETNEITVLFRDSHPNIFAFKSAPPLLYVKGNVELLSKGGVAIVGSRKCSRYGHEVAYSLGKAAAQGGITVISGGAEGIDSAALMGALENGGKVIAVFGFGMDKIYPAGNKELFARIAQNGALVSEYPLGTPAYQSHFPMRNRIISGLCDMLAVVEASVKSGTSTTVSWAHEQGKSIACVPGNITSEQSQGTNKLLKEGARIITCPEDMLEYFGKGWVRSDPELTELSPEEYEFVKAFAQEEELSLDELAQKCNNSPGALAAQLTMLELKGVLLRAQGSIYKLNRSKKYTLKDR